MKRNSAILLLLLFALLVFPIMAQEESLLDAPPTEEAPVFVVEDAVNTTAIVIGAFVTIGIMALGVLWSSVQSGKSISEAARTGAESAVRGIISSGPVAAWGETGLSHIPEPVRKAIVSINDAFSPFTSKTESDLDNKTQLWIRNLMDGDSSTGAVDLDDNPF